MKSALVLAFSMFVAELALAEPVIVTAPEIKSLLSGNSIEGTWSGDEYKQYFNENGSTTYAQRGSRETFGKWRVNEQSNEYESWWERAGWSGYGVVREGEQLFWISSGLEPQPFKVVEGHHLEWNE